MKDAKLDKEGRLVCAVCGSHELLYKRTFRSKITTGPFALLTHKKLKCQSCGEYNQVGNAHEPPPITVRDLLGAKDKEAAMAIMKASAVEMFRGRGFKGR